MESERADPRYLRALQGKASLAHRLSHVRDVREASRSGRLTRIGLPMARVAVDLLGGDEGAPVVADAIAAVLAGETDGRAANSTPPSIQICVVGPHDLARDLLAERGIDVDAHGDITIAHAQESVPMSSSSHDTLDMLRERQDLSSLVGVEEVRSGRADAFVSIGHTGATVGASAFGLGRVRGMGRPGLAVELPAAHGPVILLDCGAAPHATAEDLVRFAAVGASYARVVGIDSPRIGLLSIGGERGKGDHLRKQTDIRLAEKFPAEYVGTVEGHDLMAQARADVIVVDGFTGNVALKSMEGALRWSVGAMGSAYGSIEPAREVLRSTHLLSGASLLGVDGNIVVGHGASRADEIHGCIRRAAMLHQGSIVESVRASVSGLPELNARGELA